MIRHSGSAVNRSNLPEIYRFKIFPGGCLGYLFHSVTSIFDWSDNLVAIFEIKSKSLSVLFLSVRLTLVFEKVEIALKLFATLLAISAILASIKRWIFTWSYRSVFILSVLVPSTIHLIVGTSGITLAPVLLLPVDMVQQW